MASGAYRGRVTRLTPGGRVYVTVTRLNRAHEYGPLERLEGLSPLAGAVTSEAGTDPHTHATLEPAVELAVGDRVLVTFIEGRPDDLVVLGRLR
jgi:hypothetical protein